MTYKNEKIKVPRFNEASGFYTTKKRSKIMSKIKGKDSKPEVKFRKALWHLGYRYRKNYKKLIGKPDIVFQKYKTVIFIDGEFWHGYKWNEKKENIKSNRAFWIPKIERNMQRDQEVNQALQQDGYQVFRFWQKDIKENLNSCLEEVIKHLENIDDEPIFQTP
ncbi:very short patch repair endonuclease [Mesonia oceanica]|nr:very short patch repair endonuclease [Mesonia sp.]MAQ39694.1 very short patch repair endonuclease [Mesonia sp.]